MPRFKIHHVTRYSYEVPVRDSANQIMLYPIEDDFQEVVMHRLEVTGSPVIDIHRDYFDNTVGTFTHTQPHKELLIASSLEVVTKSKELPDDQHPIEIQWRDLENLQYTVPYIDFLRL